MLVLIYSLTLIGIAFMSRFIAISGALNRYLSGPSYACMLLISTKILTKTITRMKGIIQKPRIIRFIIGITIFTIGISIYAYSAINSNERSPWTGGLRLAPTTRLSRLEMMFVAKCGMDGYIVYSWHGAYIPREFANFHIMLSTYHLRHQILSCVAQGKPVKIERAYLILPREIVQLNAYKINNLIYIGCKYVIFVKF